MASKWAVTIHRLPSDKPVQSMTPEEREFLRSFGYEGIEDDDVEFGMYLTTLPRRVVMALKSQGTVKVDVGIRFRIRADY